MKNIEILSPAGELDSLICAVNNGADAVYVGGSQFSARKGAVNFNDEQLKFAVEYAHLRNVKVYVALNTLIHEDELIKAYGFIKYCNEIGVDALIVQDLGIVYLIKKYFPKMRIHASTQMTVHNLYGALIVKKLGFERVVLSRELSFEQIKNIIDGCDIEVEVFGHGALCMCYSGQCLMSSFIGGRSGNRGACAQPCRLPYSVCDKDKKTIGKTDKYYMSLKDLCTVDEISKFIDMGVTSLKIEGRMKSREYVSIVTSVYDKYRNGGNVSESDKELLENVFSRNGFTKGYLYSETGEQMLNFHKNNDSVYKDIKEEVHNIAKNLVNKKKKIFIDAYVSIKLGDRPYITLLYNDIKITSYGDFEVCEALKVSTDAQRIVQQVLKTGDSAFEIGNISYDIDDGINVPIKSVNELRRNAVLMLEKAITQKAPSEFFEYDYEKGDKLNVVPGLSAYVRTYSQAKKVFELGFNRIYIDYGVYNQDKVFFDEHKDLFVLMIPNICDDKILMKYKDCKLSGVCVSNISHIECFTDKILYGNYTMNVYNSMCHKMFNDMGIKSVCLSPELNINQLENLSCGLENEVIVYGRILLMTIKNCLIKSNMGKCMCSSDIHYLKDRKNMHFPFYTDKETCTNKIYNCLPVYMGDRKNDINSIKADMFRFEFVDEGENDIEYIVNSFIKGNKLTDGTYTRGHYYRGVV